MSIKVLGMVRLPCVHTSTDSCSLDTKKISLFSFFSIAKQLMSDKAGKKRSLNDRQP